MQPESNLKVSLFKRLRGRTKAWFEKIQQMGKRGTPDIVGCAKCPRCKWGRFFFIEMKRSAKERPDALQSYKLKKASEAGALSLVCSPENLDEVVESIRSLELD